VGKEIADAAVERSAFLAAIGYTRKVQKLYNGEVVKVEEYFPPNGGIAMRWLACRKPDIYREKTEMKHPVDISEGFLKLLEHIETEGRKNRERDRQLLIARYNTIDADAEEA
jgi:hypothetical protein